MQTIKGSKLIVGLSASQVRHCLQGRGFGVRKIQSGGRHQAVIIHTATGQHLRELEELLEDAKCSTDRNANG